VNDSDSVVFVVDDDASIREALSSLVRSVELPGWPSSYLPGRDRMIPTYS
jgi:FixJ family two-component response regulator